jgi:hypothetical protein
MPLFSVAESSIWFQMPLFPVAESSILLKMILSLVVKLSVYDLSDLRDSSDSKNKVK